MEGGAEERLVGLEKVKVEMITWDSSGCMSGESARVTHYRRTHKHVDQLSQSHTFSVFFFICCNAIHHAGSLTEQRHFSKLLCVFVCRYRRSL